jgi:hypothetical protein
MNRTVLKNDATGKIETIYETRRTSFQYWVTVAAQLIGIAVVVFAAVRFGVMAESKQVIEHEMQPPTGIIYMGVEKCVREEMEPIKENMIKMDTRQEAIQDDIGEIKDAVKEIAKNGT